MKRVGFILSGLAVAVSLILPVSFGVSKGGSLAMRMNVAQAGKDPFVNGKPVCLALPLIKGTQGGCGAGETEIKNEAANGGAIVVYLKLALALLNGIVGGIIVLVLVIAGITYITSAADPARVKAAKTRITQAITALVLYMFMVAILNFLVPGGVFL